MPVSVVRTVAVAAVLMSVSVAWSAAPESTKPIIGLRESTPSVHAITNLTLVIKPGQTVEKATLVLRDGLIAAAGKDVAVPADARVWDGSGQTAYAGFIDGYTEIVVPAVARDKAAPHWNPHVTPQADAIEGFTPDGAANTAHRKAGFVARFAAPAKGILKGTGAVVSTGDGTGSDAVLVRGITQHMRLTVGRGDRDGYPNSPMGAVALARQTLYDARWYANAWAAHNANAAVPRPEQNDALAALGPVLAGTVPVVIDALDDQYFLRADDFAREFDLKLILRGSGHEYRRLNQIAATGRPVILPVNFPKPPEIGTPDAAANASLERLMHWDIAPENPGRLAAAGVTLVLSSDGLKTTGDFWPAVRKAVRRGLSADAALAAVTTTPATLFGLQRLGTLEPGKAASFVLVKGDPFRDADAKFTSVWIDGVREELTPTAKDDLRGAWPLAEGLKLTLSGEPEKLRGRIKQGEKQAELKQLGYAGGRLTGQFKADAFGHDGVARLTAAVVYADEKPQQLVGAIVWPDGAAVPFAAAKPATDVPAVMADRKPVEAPKPRTAAEKAAFAVNFPLGAYGRNSAPDQPALLAFTHATVWTSGPAGTLKDATLLVQEGVVKAVGNNVKVPAGATVIDCAGKQITPGLIDCHSHMATDGGVNESGQAVTAEVRIADFIDATDITIYRQLAGGVTSSNILHGSANPIGGQNQVIKLRWGQPYQAVKFADAPPGIKFALGENVKQSNWGERYTNRYPQTRMGVEQIIRDRFLAAREYRHRQQQYVKTKQGTPPRFDLELEALAQVVHGERWIHCHSYRQDEILALLRTLDEFGVTIGSLQHILEGYKVADEMAKRGATGSAFSDWWAYKFEVYDAIPFAGALMHRNGVVVSFNSDDQELGRHLNHEAAKAVKYGGVPRAEALKFVTLNPAKQLRIDQWVGSLEPGKHADLVVWSGDPLSAMSVCEQTWIDGRRYFDRGEAKSQATENARMRAVLIQKVLASGETAEKADDAEPMERELWEREDIFCKCRTAQ